MVAADNPEGTGETRDDRSRNNCDLVVRNEPRTKEEPKLEEIGIATKNRLHQCTGGFDRVSIFPQCKSTKVFRCMSRKLTNSYNLILSGL